MKRSVARRMRTAMNGFIATQEARRIKPKTGNGKKQVKKC